MFINADKDKNPSSRSIMTSRQPQRFIYRLLITFHYVRSKCLIQCCMTTATNNKYIQLYLNSIFFLPFDALSLILRCPSCCQKRWPFICHSLAVKGQIGAYPRFPANRAAFRISTRADTVVAATMSYFSIIESKPTR